MVSKITADIRRMLIKVLTVVYKQGVFDLSASFRVPKHAAAIYSPSSPGTRGENLFAPEAYALQTRKKNMIKDCKRIHGLVNQKIEK